MQNQEKLQLQNNKYIFVHIPRTGGTFALNHLFNNGFQIYCPWSNDLMRDWTRNELYDLINQDGEFSKAALHKYSNQIHPDLQRKDRVIHSHLIAFDLEMILYAKDRGWQIFTVVRDTVWQLNSIFARFYYNSGIGVNEFIDHALKLPEVNRWFIPHWWEQFDFIILNDVLENLSGLPIKLNRRFSCHNHGFNQPIDRMDESLRSIIRREITNDSVYRTLDSHYHQRYLQCVNRSLMQDV